MARAFKQHILMWAALISVFSLTIAAAVWLKNNPPGSSVEENIRSMEEVGPSRKTPPDIELKKITEGLQAPVDIAASGMEGDGRLYVVEQGGTVKIIEDGQVQTDAFLDISDRVVSSGEQGLLGIAFDPDFAANRYFYVNYVEPTANGRRTVISRFTADDGGNSAALNSEKRILTVSQPYVNHNGGDLNFGPDGYLYIGLGDGGSAGDPQDRAQNPGSFLGKIIRIDVDSEQAYDVPEDNPFVGDNNYRPEIWSLGWRNPWRFSFDPDNGAMWIGDVGQNAFEEINHEPAGRSGRNYGWRCFEGGERFDYDGCNEDKSTYTFPVAVYEHGARPCGGSVSGGYVYRGQDYPQLNGFYFYADYCKGWIYSLDAAQPAYTSHVTLKTDLKVTTFGTDNRGELYLADVSQGAVYQVVNN